MKILLATDGSDRANAATDFLNACPLPADTEVVLISVIDKVVFGGEKPSKIIESSKYDDDHQRMLLETKQILHQDAEEHLDRTAARLTGKQVTARLIKEGHPAREIVRAAEQQSADIVIVGTHGLGGMKRFLLGSTSDDVMRYAPCSVLIVRQNDAEASDAEIVSQAGTEDHPLKILLAFDNSPSALKATELCASLSSNANNEVTALSVMPVVHLFRQDVRQQLGWLWKERLKSVKKGLEWVSKTLTAKDINVTTLLKENSDIQHEILDTASELDTDLIVIGDKGESSIKRFLIGSTTWRVAHHAPCSVLIVRVCN